VLRRRADDSWLAPRCRLVGGSDVPETKEARAPRRYVMSRRANDLVRRYLWMAALSAIRFNPAVRALYTRVVAKHPEHKAVAVGHAMRKLLHLAFAIWKSRRPFDPRYYAWDQPAHVAGSAAGASAAGGSPEVRAAGLKPDEPARTEVTATRSDTLAADGPGGEGVALDFADLKRQLPMARVLDQLGLSARLRGVGPQRRGPCPIHRGDARGRTFSVHLDDGAFHCFDPRCGRKGDVIDLWAAVRGLSLRAAALDLLHTFGLDPSPGHGTETRNG
jgi:hypothetical protein